MKTLLTAALSGALALSFGASGADKASAPQPTKEQQEMMAAYQRMAEVRQEHKQLDYFVGDWTSSTTMWMDSKTPPQKSAGKVHTQAIFGGRYIEVDMEGAMNDATYHGRGYMGFDNIAGKFFNTWMDDMSTGFWFAYGTYDKATQTYTFHGQMDDPMKAGGKVAVREVMHIVDPKHYVFEWYETRGGKEAKTLQVDYSKS